MMAQEHQSGRSTIRVTSEVFQQVYDSPRSLPGKERWLTPDDDVRRLEELLGMDSGAIGAPLWVSGDTRHCENCGRAISWLDIVSSALSGVHSADMVARVILGEQKWVNVEAPEAIENVRCHGCGTPKRDIRAFKCHNWAYAIGDLEEVVRQVSQRHRAANRDAD